MNRFLHQLSALLALVLIGTGTLHATTYYGICVGEEDVTSDNASDVLGNGQFSYDYQTKTLTVRNADLTNTGALGYGITNREIEGLVIKFIGNSTFTTRNSSIYSAKSFSITGTGTLNGTSNDSHGLYLYGGTTVCTINGPKINLKGAKNGVYGYFGTEELVVEGDYTSLTLEAGEGKWPFRGVRNLTLGDGMYVTEPFGGWYSPELNNITTDGTTVYTGKVTIGQPKYFGLLIGETEVTTANATDVLGDGQFSYDPLTNMLTVSNANLTNKDGRLGGGIDNRSAEGLVVQLEGDNVFTVRNTVISSQVSLSITGSGTLTGVSTGGNGLFFWNENDMTCTIDGPKLDLTALGNGLGDYYHTTTLRVEGGTTSLTLRPGNSFAAVEGLKDLTFNDDVHIVSPAGAWFSPEMQSVTTDGTMPYKGTVVIAKPEDYGLHIGEEHVTSANASDVLGNGQFSYDNDTKTLYVRNANLSNSGIQGCGISNWSVGDLTIVLEGENTFYTRNAVIDSQESFTITGTGTLTGTSYEGYPFYLWGDSITCTINGPTINLTGTTNGMNCYKPNNTLAVEGYSIVSLEPAENWVTITCLGHLRLGEGQYITEPAGGFFSEDLQTVTTDNVTPYSGRVLISRKRPEVPVTEGDVNSDGKIDVADIANILTIMANNISDTAADVNHDGKVDVADIAAVLTLMANKH
ncbi:MAG: dockerin type I repeat-containing protein [Prevotella sp.]|nr:dockerin type I repeat-containing protein [Prevotella sp.]